MEPALERAAKHVKGIRDFLYHLMTFVFVTGLLVILDVRGGTNDHAVVGLDWAYWVILFWGLGVVGHAISVFLDDSAVHRAYEKEKARELADV
jgi:hypothetical protein